MRQLTKVCLPLCLFAIASLAADSDKKPASSDVKPVTKTSTDAVTVFVDPATGKVKQPTQAEIDALSAETRVRASTKETKAPSSEVIYGPGGAVGLKLGPESTSYIVVTKKPDGTLATECVTGETAATKAVSK